MTNYEYYIQRWALKVMKRWGCLMKMGHCKLCSSGHAVGSHWSKAAKVCGFHSTTANRAVVNRAVVQGALGWCVATRQLLMLKHSGKGSHQSKDFLVHTLCLNLPRPHPLQKSRRTQRLWSAAPHSHVQARKAASGQGHEPVRAPALEAAFNTAQQDIVGEHAAHASNCML